MDEERDEIGTGPVGPLQRRKVATQQEVDAILIARIRMVKRRRALRHRDGSAVALPAPGGDA